MAFDVVVVCARFQPPHSGHFAALAFAASLAPRVIALCLGADDARSLKNPWSSEERVAMLRAGLGGAHEPTFVMLRDLRYDPLRWTRRARETVAACAGGAARIGVIAECPSGVIHLPLPADWIAIDQPVAFDSVEYALRQRLFWPTSADAWRDIERELPAPVVAHVRAHVASEAGATLREEAAFIHDFRQRWALAPHPPVFVTVDALATWRRHVLLIERGRLPGKGLWALPGGFIDRDETLAAGCVRELHEETGIALAARDIRDSRVFDDPGRSLRGRTITHVFRFVLDECAEPPAATGGDDAAAAAWVAFEALSPSRMFEDHHAILQLMLGLD